MSNRMLGRKAADNYLTTFLVHLEEIRRGVADIDSLNICSVYLQAMLATVTSYKNHTVTSAVYDACQAWVDADKRRIDLGSRRMLLTGDQMKAVSRAVKYFDIMLPSVHAHVWLRALDIGAEQVHKCIQEYNAQHAVNT